MQKPQHLDCCKIEFYREKMTYWRTYQLRLKNYFYVLGIIYDIFMKEEEKSRVSSERSEKKREV
jgi:hypothetical protein